MGTLLSMDEEPPQGRGAKRGVMNPTEKSA